MRRTVLVMLFLMRMRDIRITATESISQIGRMVHKLQKVLTIMMSKLENLEDKMEGISLEVKKLARLHSNRHADQQSRQEPYQESATASRSNAKNFHLRFLNGLKPPIYTEENITSESNSAIRIGIFDGDGNMIREGPLSKVKVEMLVLRGDFCNDGRESWTEEEFNNHVEQGRHGQGFVLGGDCTVWLNNGEASFGVIRFKEGSCRRKFIVGARVCVDGKTADRVREAVMKPVTVKDRRNKPNEKRHPPELDDEVYRLEEIAKDGIYHKRLQKAQIFTLQEFLKALNKDANKLRQEVLRIKKHSSSWEKLVKHARECCLGNKHELKAYQNVEGNVVLFLNCVHDLVGAKFSGVYIAQENFDPAKKALAYELKECVGDQLDSLPFNYVMNGNLPEQVSPSTHSSLDAGILAPDEALQGERIPPLSQQQPTGFAGLQHWDVEPSDWFFEGQANIHSQMQVLMSIDGGSAMEASTSAQNNLLPQQFLPNQFQESMRGMHYPDVVPNPVAEPSTWHDDHLPETQPSTYQFPGPGYENF